MTILLPALLCLASLAVLVKAADEFVEGAVHVSEGFNLSPVVVGALVLGFGTSAPELVVSSIAAIGGESDVGVGNIVGSNLANLSLVLGTAAVVAALACPPSVVRREGPIALAAMAMFSFFVVDGRFSTAEGVIMLVSMLAALGLLLRGSQEEHDHLVDDHVSSYVDTVTSMTDVVVRNEVIRTALGLVSTVGAGWLLIIGAERIAAELNLTGGFISFTLFAIGTSLPELVTALAAARKGETELILGNLFGSNVFNSLTVGAAVALLGPGDIGSPRITGWALGAMMLVAIGVFAALVIGKKVVRWHGVVLLAIYLGCLPISFEQEEDVDEALARYPSAAPISPESAAGPFSGGG